MTNMNDIKKMKDAEVHAFINEKREVVRAAGFGTAGKNAHSGRDARKDIARALTELQARSAASVSDTKAE